MRRLFLHLKNILRRNLVKSKINNQVMPTSLEMLEEIVLEKLRESKKNSRLVSIYLPRILEKLKKMVEKGRCRLEMN